MESDLKHDEQAVKASSQINDILEACGAAVMDNDNPTTVFTGFCNEVIPPELKPLNLDPTVDITYENTIFLEDL